MIRNDIRNIAIIAHVDHGKTTLVDAMLKQSGVFRANERVEERVMDSNALERERGITILSKNTAVMHNGVKINILDTPGHADFGGEVERVLTMVDGVLLLVDAYEGPMPQTKYVLRKALQQHLKPIVVINKIDRPDQRVDEVIDEVLDLFIEPDADEDQLEFPVVLASARNGIAKLSMDEESNSLEPLFKVILENIPAPDVDVNAPLQMLVNTLDYDDYVGRIVVGRVVRGTIHNGENIILMDEAGNRNGKIGRLYTYQGLKRVEVPEVEAGDIVALIGLQDANIGDTIADSENPEALKGIKIDEPTLSMIFYVNNSPFAGREGEFVTSRHLRDRLFKEVKTNVSMRVTETESPDAYEVAGRGELHLSILIETMRREGYELQVGQPQVIFKEIDGVKCEPIEELTISVPEEFASKMIDMVTRRKGEMVSMETQGDRVNIEFDMPSRGIIGLRTNVLTASQGEAIMAHRFKEYQPFKGDIPRRTNGSMIAMESGTAFAYAIDKLQDRGKFFIYPQDEVYAGQVVGEHVHENDLVINVTRSKKLTNMRASGSDDKARIIPPVIFSLEEALEYIKEDEYVEVTPKSMRMRKVILDETERKRANKN